MSWQAFVITWLFVLGSATALITVTWWPRRRRRRRNVDEHEDYIVAAADTGALFELNGATLVALVVRAPDEQAAIDVALKMDLPDDVELVAYGVKTRGV